MLAETGEEAAPLAVLRLEDADAGVPRYFFDVRGLAAIRDEDGVVCADIIAAKRQAALLASGLLRDAPDQLWNADELTVSVRSDSGLQLFSIVVLGLTTPAMSGRRSLSAH